MVDRCQQSAVRAGAWHRIFHDLAGKGVAESVSGADEVRLARCIAERLANLGDQAGKVRLGHERRRPQVLVQLVFRHGPRTLIKQSLEELERFRR